jgi:hypothetical protein
MRAAAALGADTPLAPFIEMPVDRGIEVTDSQTDFA